MGVLYTSIHAHTKGETLEKIAIIDLGSNSIRLVLANIMSGGYFVIFDEQKENVKLGADIEKEGYIKPARVTQTIRTLKMFRKLCDSHGAEKVFCIGANFLTRAKNQKSFIEEINAVCGFKFKVSSEEEEATQTYQGIINSLDVPKGVIMDISGSNLMLIQYNRRNLINREVLPIGTLILNSLFSDQPPKVQAKMVEAYVLDQLKSIQWLKNIEPDYQFIGVGGAFRNLAKIGRRIRRYPIDMIHNYHMAGTEFSAIYDMVKVLDPTERTKIKGLNQERADIFSISLSTINAVMKKCGFSNIIVSGAGLRESIMFNYSVPTTVEKPITDVMGHSVYTMMNYYGINIPHAEHVCNLCIQLYKQLRVLHKLPRQYVRALRIAALMHDVGTRIKFYDHNRHTFYFILNSNLYGVSHRDIVLAAFIAKGHRGDASEMEEWNKYKGILIEQDLIAVIKLSVILRIAKSLDRSMAGAVKALNCDVLGDSVIMKTEVEGDCTLEIKDAMKVAPDFARAYRKNIEIL